jgi:H+/Cl- antiporter ClcA
LETDEAAKFSVIWHTLAAILVAFVTSLVASVAVNFLMIVANSIFSDEPAWLIQLSAGLVSAGVGVYAARLACDHLFSHYSKRAVFLMFAAFGIVALCMIFYVGLYDCNCSPYHWKRLTCES